jgi:alanine racemase
MSNPQTQKTKKRLNLDLTPEAYELLQKLSDESGKNMADVLRTGLALYGIAQEEKDKGHTLAIVETETNTVVSRIVTT